MPVERCIYANVYMQVDTGDPTQIYQILDAENHLTVNQRSVLNIIHCLTGCDTTSVPFSKGKETSEKDGKWWNSGPPGFQWFECKPRGDTSCRGTLNKQCYLRYNQRIAKLPPPPPPPTNKEWGPLLLCFGHILRVCANFEPHWTLFDMTASLHN